MKTIILVLNFTLWCIMLHAQQTFLLEGPNDEPARVFDTFQDALENLQSGDTFYLPGGVIDVQSDQILIEVNDVNIIGAGYNPFSSAATGSTIISSSTENDNWNILRVTSENVFITGIDIQGTVSLAGVENSIQRCKANGCSLNSCSSCELKEMVTGEISGNSSSEQILVHANYIDGNIVGFQGPNVAFTNNIIVGTTTSIGSGWGGVIRSDGCYFYRNIIVGTWEAGFYNIIGSGLPAAHNNV
ncbi:MAG: hypothetical protein AAF193_03020, partial [Bacteroidota bacterium]